MSDEITPGTLVSFDIPLPMFCKRPVVFSDGHMYYHPSGSPMLIVACEVVGAEEGICTMAFALTYRGLGWVIFFHEHLVTVHPCV